MKRALHSFAAVLFGILLVTAAALGGVWATNPNVDSFEEATNQVVAEGDAVFGVGTAVLIGIAAGGGVAVAKWLENDPSAKDLRKADALETKKAIYNTLSTQKQNNEIVQTAYGNYLNDTQSIALMTAKNAYIRALENGSSEAVARNKAKTAAADYYAQKQRNLIASWNSTLITWNSSRFTAKDSPGVNANFVNLNVQTGASTDFRGIGSTSVQLINGSTTQVKTVTIFASWGGGTAEDGTSNHYFNTGEVTLAKGPHVTNYYLTLKSLGVKPPVQEQFTSLSLGHTSDYRAKWDRIEQQNSEVQAQLDTFINKTYSAYQQGDINASTLVDPYLGMREYAPENATQFQSWAIRSLSALGLNSPQNLSNVGHMTVLSGGQTYKGILMSDENPEGGFVVGNTYNASKLNGSQFVAPGDGGMVKLDGEFTLKSAETAQGTTIKKNETIVYRNVSYKTANMTEYRQLQQKLNRLQAQVNARQQRLRNAGGGLFGGLGFGGGLGAPVGLLVLAGAAVFVLGRD